MANTDLPSSQNHSKNEESRPIPPKEDREKSAPSVPHVKSKGARRRERIAAQKASTPEQKQRRNLENARKSLEKAKAKAGIQSRTSNVADNESIAGSGQSVQKVTQMLEKRAKKAGDGGRSEQAQGTEERPRKLAHIAGFISAKHSGSVSSTDQQVTGEFLSLNLKMDVA